MKEFKKTYENVYYSYQSNTIKASKVWYDDLNAKQQANPDFVEMAAKLIRTNPDSAYVEIQDLDGRTILAYRGEHPGGKKFTLNQSGET